MLKTNLSALIGTNNSNKYTKLNNDNVRINVRVNYQSKTP